MDTCLVETGLLKKKPCGQPAVTHCANCEQALCAKHAIAEITDTGRKSGKYLCKECHAAWREIAKSGMQPSPPGAKTAAPAKDATAPDAAAKNVPAKDAGKKAPAESKPADSKPADSKDDGGIDFTPSKK